MATPINGYCTLADMLAFLPNSTNASTSQIELSIEGASRAIENWSGKAYYPSIKTNTYDIDNWYSREITFVDDLLELITLTNGDATTITSTDYDLSPYNIYPKKRVTLKQFSSKVFTESPTGGNFNCISILGLWGYARNYSASWYAASTLNGGINASVTAMNVVSGTSYQAGQILRVEDELMRVTVVSTNALTVDRGWNGSTAAAHLTGLGAKIWNAESDIKRACLIQAARYFRRADAIFGTQGGGELGVLAVAIPTLDPDVKAILEPYTDKI